MKVQTAAEFTIPGLEVIKAYRLDNQAYVSKSQLCLATRNHKDTKPINTWLNAAANPSDVKGSQGFPRGFDAAAIVAAVPRDQGGFSEAHLIKPMTAYLWLLHEADNRSAKVRDRAMKLIISVGAVGFDTLVKQAAGIEYSPVASLQAWFKTQPTHETAEPINQLKKVLIDLGYRDRTKRMGELINEFFYNRLPVEVFEQCKVLKREYHAKHNTWCGPSMFQCLSTDVQQQFNIFAGAALTLINNNDFSISMMNTREMIQALDRVFPRYRASYVPLAKY